MLIPRHSGVRGRVDSEAWNGMELQEKNVFCKKSCSSKQNWELVFVCKLLQSEILRVCFYFCSTERNYVLFCLPRNGSELNLFASIFVLQNRITSISPLRNGSERNSKSFLFHGRAEIPPEQTNCSVYSVFIRIIFCRNLSTLFPDTRHERRHGCIAIFRQLMLTVASGIATEPE